MDLPSLVVVVPLAPLVSLALCDRARLDECVDVYRRNSYPRIAEVRLALPFIGFASTLTLSPGLQLTMLINTSSDFELTIRQQPDRARVAGGKEKGLLLCALPSTG